MIAVSGLSKRFQKKWALSELSVELGKGVYGLLGPNGSGKNTLIRCMMGIYRPTAGHILLDGQPVSRKNSMADRAGYLPQQFGVYGDLRVYEALEYIAAVRELQVAGLDREITRCLEKVNLQRRIDTKVKTLSGGMLRRLGVAAALLGDPEILLFDEPTVGLDPEERMRFKSIVEGMWGKKTILLSTHILADVEALCDFIVIVKEGRVLHNLPQKEVRHLADGLVYETAQFPEVGELVETQALEGEKRYRVLSRQKPAGGVLVEPRTEDGYLCAIKGI